MRRLVRASLMLRAIEYRTWSSSAIVFAPHPDDETLGCGGTIAKKRRRGANVQVAFMTDGCRSHEGRISPEKLRSLRRAEAEAACRELGVDAANLTFLQIEDGTLEQHVRPAGAKVRELLEGYRPQEVFVPYHGDNQVDHVATRRVVWDALSTVRFPVQVFEYPIWFWYHWPWVRLRRNGRSVRAVFQAAARSEHLLYRDLRCAADVREAVATKRAALERHRSQMQRLRDDAYWPILSDVSDGEWLECFFIGHELFYSYTMPADADSSHHDS
jgi:LmbE family N-acetylglucosaminyl deacetylase